MNLWSTRTASQTWLASELQVESEFLDQGFNLLQECIYNYNVLYKTSSSSEPFIEVSAYTTLKAHHLLLGIYSLSFDGLSQESGALLRPLVYNRPPKLVLMQRLLHHGLYPGMWGPMPC